MNHDDKAVIQARYRERLEKYTQERDILATGSEERQQIRYAALAEVGHLNGCTVLDVGCGLAGFYRFLKAAGINVKYNGYDIVPEFIKLNRERFPDAEFYLKDILEDGFDRQYDYIICSQVFNNKYTQEHNLAVVKKVIQLCYQNMRRGFVIDFLTSYVDYQDEQLYYYNPETLFTFAKGITKRVTLRHDYPLFEFCLYLYPDFKGWKNSSV